MNVMKIGHGGVDWIPLVLNRTQWRLLVDTAVSPQAPLRMRKCFTNLVIISVSRSLLQGVSWGGEAITMSI
jgi:hypothetical protein